MTKLIDQLVLIAGQWQQFQEKQYERQFARLLNDLAWELQTNQEGALEYFMAHLGETEGVAV